MTEYRNRRHVMGFRFSDVGESGSTSTFPAQTQSVIVPRPFLLASITAVGRCSGQYSAAGYPSTYMNISLNSAGFEGQYWFDFLWKLSDTSRQREWTRGWQPSAFLQSSTPAGPMDLPKRNPFPAGTELKMQVMPIRALRTYVGEGATVTISQYDLEVSFVGVEHV